MKERTEYTIEQKAKDSAMLNFVNRQAQEAILDPNLSEAYKDYILDAALKTIQRIGENKSSYVVRQAKKTLSKPSGPANKSV